MPRMIESEMTSSGIKESWQVHRSLIKPSDNVAVVGPGESLFIDPTLVAVAQIMAGGGGELVAVDPKCSDSLAQIEYHPVESRVAGVGNIDTYLNEIRTLQSL